MAKIPLRLLFIGVITYFCAIINIAVHLIMTFYLFSKAIGKAAPILLSVGLLAGIYLYNRLNSMHKSILLYLFLMLGIDVSSRVLGSFGNNLVILPIFSLIELTFFVYFYNKYLLAKPNKVLIGLGAVGALYIISEMLQYFVFNTLNIKQFQPYAKVADNFVVIIMALSFFYQKMNSFNETRWGNFKLNTVVLIYFTFNTMVFLPFNFMINESSGVKFYFWMANFMLILLFYGYLISLIWKSGKRQGKVQLV